MAYRVSVNDENLELSRLKFICLRDGTRLDDVYFNSYAMRLPGFLAIRYTTASKENIYINVNEIEAIAIADKDSAEIGSNLIEPLTVRVKE